MTTTKEMIAVMQAFADGKTIQYSIKNEDNWHDAACELGWNWCDCDYRIKSEPKYVPYDNISEVERDKWVRNKRTGRLYRIAGVCKNGVFIGIVWSSFDELFDNFTYEDGTPCGKLVEA